MHRIRLLVSLVALALILGAPARASTSGLVVSQVYAGGGNSGASYTNDFVEIFNGGSSAADLTGWSVQYASAASTSWSVTALAGSVQPGRYHLVQLASSGSVGAALPSPDTTGTTNIANSGGKVALVSATTALACGASAGSCSAVSSVVDLLGYGSATDYEGSGAAPALSSTTAATRAGNGCTDTGSNSADFTAIVPSPRNSATAAVACSSAPPPSANVSEDAGVDVDIQPVLSLTLERPTISFGTVVAGDTPAAVSERVTVVSNNATGYALSVHRTAFTPADLPLAISGIGALRRDDRIRARGRRARRHPDRAGCRSDDRVVRDAQRKRRGCLADEHRVLVADPDARSRPLLRDAHVHADRAVIACFAVAACLLAPASPGAGSARPPVSLVASPARVALSGAARQVVTADEHRDESCGGRAAQGWVWARPEGPAADPHPSPLVDNRPPAAGGDCTRRTVPPRRRVGPAPARPARRPLGARAADHAAGPYSGALGAHAARTARRRPGAGTDRPAPGRRARPFPAPPRGSGRQSRQRDGDDLRALLHRHRPPRAPRGRTAAPARSDDPASCLRASRLSAPACPRPGQGRRCALARPAVRATADTRLCSAALARRGARSCRCGPGGASRTRRSPSRARASGRCRRGRSTIGAGGTDRPRT